MERSRIVYSAAAVVVIITGLASRRYAALLPAWITPYIGDVLWALMVFLGVGFLFPRWSTLKTALVAAVIPLTVEISQLYQAAWINAIRRTTLGGLVLGFGFLWSDLIAYAAGVATGVLLETVASRFVKR